MIKDIKLVGGIHNRGDFAPHEITEKVLEEMIYEIMATIENHTKMDSYVYFEFVKQIGGKVNS